MTEAAHAVANSALPRGFSLVDLGAHRLRDLLQAEHSGKAVERQVVHG